MSVFVFALFPISGACGLINEVVWSRTMTLIFGRSVLAVGTVLAAFMWGLAIGSYLLGKYADRNRNPLRLYAIYEIRAGITSFIASFILARITPIYEWAHANFGTSPRDYAVSPNGRTLVNHSMLTEIRGPDFDRFVMKGISGAEKVRLQAAFQAENIFLEGHTSQLRGDASPAIMVRYDQAIGLAPWDRNLRNEVVSYLNREYLSLYSSGDYPAPRAFFVKRRKYTLRAPMFTEIMDGCSGE